MFFLMFFGCLLPSRAWPRRRLAELVACYTGANRGSTRTSSVVMQLGLSCFGLEPSPVLVGVNGNQRENRFASLGSSTEDMPNPRYSYPPLQLHGVLGILGQKCKFRARNLNGRKLWHVLICTGFELVSNVFQIGLVLVQRWCIVGLVLVSQFSIGSKVPPMLADNRFSIGKIRLSIGRFGVMEK